MMGHLKRKPSKAFNGQFIRLLGKFYEEGVLCDCQLFTGRPILESIYCHRIVLAAAGSDYFETIFKLPLKAATGNGGSQVIDYVIPDIPFKYLKAIVDYVYKKPLDLREDELATFFHFAHEFGFSVTKDDLISVSNDMPPHQIGTFSRSSIVKLNLSFASLLSQIRSTLAVKGPPVAIRMTH